MTRARLSAFCMCVLAAGLAMGQQDEGPRGRGGFRGKAPSKGKEASASKLKRYDDVITKDAQTLPGVIAVHRLEDKVYFEIPQEVFGRLMLWRAEVARGPAGLSWGGMSLGHYVLRWERRGHKVFLWKVGFAKRGDGAAAKSSVESANHDTIVAGFNVEAEGKDRSTVIHVTALFTTEMGDLSVRGAVGGAAGVDESRSYLSDVKSFPTNVEVRSVLTFRGGGGGGGAFGRGRPALEGGPSRSHTALIHYSLVLLPETPMRGRYFDSRVGYFTESFETYDDPKTWMVRRQVITRYRLEKKDPTAAVSEPVQPIVFYLSHEVPEKWRAYLKKGVEDWKPAFEEAGFKNAIICKDAPSRAQDPGWDPEDARWSVIRWVAEPIANAMGPNVHDPRSGEVISAHVIFWHDILKIQQLWYFVQCAALDSKARKLPLPDELNGELLRYVAAHEVGHTLGLRHNHRASQAYSIKELRDPAFTAKHGSVASIMSYGRFNYVAQPEDKVQRLIPVIGPYDSFAICWGYKAVPGAAAAEAERPTLDRWAARQLKEPFLRFGGEDGPAMVDQTVLTENIGSDPVQATALGLKNLDRVANYLLAATMTRNEDASLLEEVYQSILTHERNWFGAVAKQVAGVVENRSLGTDGTVPAFGRISREKQQEAVHFLVEHAFITPPRLLNPGVLNEFSYSGVADGVLTMQKGLLTSLLSPERLHRLFDAEVLGGDKSYTAQNLVRDLQDGLWSELAQSQPKIEPLRRQLQMAYLEILKEEFEPPAPTGPAGFPGRRARRGGGEEHVSELRAVARTSLRDLSKRINTVLPQVKDAATQAHLEDSLGEIETALTAGKVQLRRAQ